MKIAHIDNDRKQSIQEHCENVARLASLFAESINESDRAKLAGLLHDIGKYSSEFQKHIINQDNLHFDHSTAGAKEAIAMKELEIALCVAGHHCGIPDFGSNYDTENDPTLIGRCKKDIPDYSLWKNDIKVNAVDSPKRFGNYYEDMFFTRMLYSCLVDADYIDTEAFMNGKQLRSDIDNIPHLKAVFNKHTSALLAKASNRLNAARNSILKKCLEKSEASKKGIYRLSLPTGSGKTLDSMAFALNHAVKNGQNRIIYVIPYNSIIDQTSMVYSAILGDDNILEHHSEIVYEEDSDEMNPKKRLAIENWDYPIILTTAVQFFNSLYSYKPSKCRKLHNIANSVIIFDEAQNIPVKYLKPCLLAIYELYKNYNCTIVLSTATQPPFEALYKDMGINIPIKNICILSNQEKEVFERHIIKNAGSMNVDKLSETISHLKTALVVVNTKKAALNIFNAISHQNKYYLTTNLIPADRKKKISRIKTDLADGKSCVVVSTSLIEAGVDLDFDTVYREYCGVDSIIQSAGRCNREGRKNKNECVAYWFQLEGASPWSGIEQNIASANQALRNEDKICDETIEKYYEYLWYLKDTDQEEILDLHNKGFNGTVMPFREIGKKFSLLDEETEPVYIVNEENSDLIRQLKYGARSKSLFRKLNQYAVNLYPNHIRIMQEKGSITVLEDDIYLMEDASAYNDITGLIIEQQNDGIFY